MKPKTYAEQQAHERAKMIVETAFRISERHFASGEAPDPDNDNQERME